MAKVILKVELSSEIIQMIELPEDHKILSLHTQIGKPLSKPSMWVLVDPKKEKRKEIFEIYKTGEEIFPIYKESEYVGSWFEGPAGDEFHLFKVIK